MSKHSIDSTLDQRPDIDELMEDVNVGDKWYELGIQLKIGSKALTSIDKEQSDISMKLCKMYEKWLSTSPDATRRQLLEALKRQSVNELHIAKEYEKKLTKEQQQNVQTVTEQIPQGIEMGPIQPDPLPQDVLDDLLKKHSVQEECLNMKFTDDLLILLTLQIKNMEEIAPHFDMSEDEIWQIKRDENGNENGRVASMLSIWRERNRDRATCLSLVNIFSKIGHKDIIDSIISNIHQKYISDSATDTYTCTLPFNPITYPNWKYLSESDKEHIRNKLINEANKVKKCFATTFSGIHKSFVERKVDHNQVIAHVELLQPFECEYQTYFESLPPDDEKEKDKTRQISVVFRFFTRKCNWIDYHLLDAVTEIYGSDEDKSAMSTYINKMLWPFLQRSLYEIPPESVGSHSVSPRMYHFILPITEDHIINGQQLQQIKLLLSEKLQVQLQHIHVKFETGSIIVHFLVDKQLFDTNDIRLSGFVKSDKPDTYLLDADWIRNSSAINSKPNTVNDKTEKNKNSTAKGSSYRPNVGSHFVALNPTDDRAIAVQFNAVLPLQAWEWKDDCSSVHLRFGHEKLGNWKYDTVPGKILIRSNDELSVVKFELKFDIDFIKSLRNRGIPYKYVVYSPRLNNDESNHPYEFLYGAPPNEQSHNNRLLKIPQHKICPGGYYQQFDTMIFPEIKREGTIKRIWELVKSGSVNSNPTPPIMRSQCMEIHLKPIEDILLKGKYVTSLHAGVDGCVGLYRCAYLQYVEQRGSEREWPVPEVFDTLIKWSERIASKLLTSDNTLETHKVLISGLTLACSLWKCTKSVPYSFPIELRLLCVQIMGLYTTAQKDEMEIVHSYFLNDDQSKIYAKDVISYLIQTLNEAKKTDYSIDILKALPLYHFLNDGIKPNTPFHYGPLNKIKWGDVALELSSMKSCLEDKAGFIEKHSKTIEKLCLLDSKLVYVIPYICPTKDTCQLSEILPLDIAIAWIPESLLLNLSSMKLSDISNNNMKERFTKPMACIQQLIFEKQLIDFESINWCADAVIFLMDSLKGKLTDVSKHAHTFISSTVSLSLYILYKAKTFQEQSKESIIETLRIRTIALLKDWITKHKVIGGSFFGGSIKYNGAFPVDLRKGVKELEIWEGILKIAVPVKEMKEELEGIVTHLVTERVSEIPSAELKINLFINVESQDESSDIFRNIFLIKATEALDQMVLKKESHNLRSWGKIIETKSDRIIELIAKILQKQYPNFQQKEGVPFTDLLEWDLWAGFLRIYTTQSEINKSKIDSEWQLIVICAISVFENVCKNIHSGDITITELEHIKSNQIQMNRLCDAVSGTKSVPLASVTQASALRSSMAQRLKEFEYFKNYMTKLDHLVTHIGGILEGHAELKKTLSLNYRKKKINSLCWTLANGTCEVLCFPNTKPLESCLEHFYTVSFVYSSDLFNKFWRAEIDKLSKPVISFSEVDTVLWKPVFNKCVELLDKLHSREIELSEVDSLFKPNYSTNQKALLKDLQDLHVAVSSCKNKPANIDWLRSVVDQIKQYWDLCNYREAARAFIKIRNTLNLTGDFTLVERVAEQTSISLGKQTLKSIDQSIVEAGRFLQTYANDSTKRDCLEAFAECQKIVEWIRKVTTDVTSLLNFVTVALATAAGGEGDMTADRLSYLRTVGSGFGPLIYKLKTTAGYSELQEHCKTLWETLEYAPNLPQMMRTCEEQIDWYQSVKETQGSVEVTSFGQMHNINKYGYYEIGTSKKLLVSRSEGIRLRLRQPKTKKIYKLNYTLDELRDLESKLVLITGHESEERKGVDLFLDVFYSVCRITDVLIELQQTGNDRYIGWTLTINCFMDDIVHNLQLQASEMEEDLRQWREELSEHRTQFYELNYFTTPQLLSLREELGQYKECNPSLAKPVKSEVMSLIQCLSREISSNSVIDEVQIVSRILQEQKLAESQFSSTVRIPFTSVEQQEVSIPNDLDTQNISETVPDTKVSSLNSSVLEHVLKADKGPQPQLTENDLTDKQKATLDNLKEQYGYSRRLILLAFERSARPDIEDAVRDWCNENQKNFNFSDSYVDTESCSASSSYHSDEEEQELDDIVMEDDSIPVVVMETSQPQEILQKSFSKNNAPKVVFVERVPVDVNHPVVKELLEAGYDIEESLIAAEEYPDDVSNAIAFLMENSLALEQGELFSRSSPIHSGLERQISDEGFGRQDSEESIDTESAMKITSCNKSTESYLSILELAPVDQERTFPEGLKHGEPNLLVTVPDQVFKTVLSLYMENEQLPMPTYEEVLICNEHTTAEEVTLLWKKAIKDPNDYRIFCLVHAELLSYQVCDKALRSLLEYTQGQKKCKIVIVCSSEDEDKSHMVSKLQLFKRQLSTFYSDAQYSQYLKYHFIQRTVANRTLASDVDNENSYVRVVTSDRTGMGKSLYIQRLKDLLRSKTRQELYDVIIPVHGPKVTFDSIVHSLTYPFEITKQNRDQPLIFHLDISPSVLRQVDSVLFSLLILQGISDSQGRIWRCHPAHLYAIEATVLKNYEKYAKQTVSLLRLLPTMRCVSPRQVCDVLQSGREDQMVRTMDEGEFRKPNFQRVFQYLRRHETGISLDRFMYGLQSVEGRPVECLQILLKHCGVRDPSWSELKHFVEFLDTQLQSCENSIFFNEDIVGDVMFGLKTFVVKFMIRMSKDFATSSLKGEVAAENQEFINIEEQLQEYQIDERKQWEQSYHPYLFFNEDGMSITFVGFNATRNGDLNDPVKGQIIEPRAMTPQLYTGLLHYQVNLSENYQAWGKDTMIQKIGTVMGLEWSSDPDPTYVLTVDNVIKIMAIHMRFRCNIPVVIMGETGCGKTRLIRYMCDLAAQGCINGGDHVQNMLIMKVHGGTTEQNIIDKVKEAERKAALNRNEHEIYTVLFFDEANTTEAIGLIKEVMCDRRICGRPVQADVKFIAACNPYRKHTDEMITKLESAGLGFYVKGTETQQKLGKIPLRQLVYRVLDLPPSMRPLVYDFGQLNNATEKDYTHQIVKDRCTDIPNVVGQTGIIDSVADVLAWSQKYMRERNDECSFVSLRDVERAMIVFKYFCQKTDHFSQRVIEKAIAEDKPVVTDISRSLILAVSVCYHARLQDRSDYENGVVLQFKASIGIPGGVEQFRNEIRWCQEVLLDNMKLGPNIARNAALRENVFMMAICIELRIPLFLVGKPGSSKSLAKSIVSDSMLGRTSEKDLMKEFKEVHMFSYQCSQLSTPESVIEVFNTAKSFQKKQDTTNYVSVVVLDEVGLAEDSPNLPLKALHPLLEDGTEGADESQQIIDREQRVAFIGISNWALDPAKMNRGVMVTRGDPDEKELELSARGICSNHDNDPVKERLEAYFHPLSAAYKQICDEQNKIGKAFFGLRDFYSLIKMLYWMCENSSRPPTGPQLQHAIKRNFGGLEDFDTYEIFKSFVHNTEQSPDLSTASEMDRELLSPDCSPLGLIRKSLQTKETSWHGENRYLLFLTENYAALQVIKHYLHEEVGLKTNEAEGGLEEPTAVVRQMEPLVLFGSSFFKDKEYTQVCRNINQIKICMETGRTVILLNLENLYESLYDLLNQYYIQLGGGQRYVDLGLQTHRVKCRVHNDFKLILIAEKSTVYEKFPTPLINRLEKHFVQTETVLKPWQKEVLDTLNIWIDEFTTISHGNTKFTKQDAFVGYQNDTPSSVIFQATEQLKQEIHPEDENSEDWKKAVVIRSKRILLQMASPDALIRLKSNSLERQHKRLHHIYFSEQHHGSIVQFLKYHIESYNNPGHCGLLIQVTTHSHLLSGPEVDELCCYINMKQDQVLHFLLQEFDTEMDFSHKVSPAFSHQNQKDTLLIIQCDSGHLYGDLIACARYRIDDEREKANLRYVDGNTHVLFIIHLPRQAGEMETSSSFVGFQGGVWISAHIDDIRAPPESALTLDEAFNAPISELFYNGEFVHRESEVEIPTEMDVDEVNEQNLESITQQSEEMTTHSEEMEVEDLENVNLQIFSNEIEEMITEEEPVEDIAMEDHTELEQDEYDEDNLMESQPIVTEPIPVTQPRRQQHNQCNRLCNCIQGAVARLIENDDTRKEWTAIRVKLLLDLIPQHLQKTPLDDHTFYGALVKHIRNILKERDKVQVDKDWVLNEALSGLKLQNGGTFQNVLTRRLDEVITPIFSAILSFVDRYSNLDLINPRQQTSKVLQELWIEIFTSENICQFSYESFSMGKGLGNNDNLRRGQQLTVKEEFVCQFPFFWLIKEAIESKWETSKTTSINEQHTQLCMLLDDTPIASVLHKVSEEHWMELYHCYLYDFIRSVHHVPHHKSNDEYEILSKALDAIITGPNFVLTSFLSQLVAVHIVYHNYQQEIMWFGQLTTHIPGILVHLHKEEHSPEVMELQLNAVKIAIKEELALPLDPEDREYIPERLVKLHLCQNAIDSILSLNSSNEMISKIRCSWQHVRAIQLFLEHIVTKFAVKDKKFTELVCYAKRIELFLESLDDFTNVKTIEKVQTVLEVLDGDSGKKKLKYSAETQKKLRNYCKSYFMEVVSSLCFGQLSPPEPALIEELLNVVFTEQDQTKDFTYSDKEEIDKVPVIRSFLLQLLLEHNTDVVREHLENYFTKSRHLINDDRSLFLLCIQCFEDAIHKQYSRDSLHGRVTASYKLLKQGKGAVLSSSDSSARGTISVQYLEGIAKLRYSLTVVAELLQYQHNEEGRYFTHEAHVLLVSAKKFCELKDDIFNTDDTGPAVFLVKQIARQYGVTFLIDLISNQTMEWVVPTNLRRSKEEPQTSDPFVMYQVYKKLRSTLNDAVYSEDLTQLTETSQEFNVSDSVPLLLAIYQIITGNRVYTDESKHISAKITNEVLSFTRNCKILKRELMWIIQHLIEDTYSGGLEPMVLRPGMSPQNRLLTDLVIHVVASIQNQPNSEILKPFIKMMNSPGELKNVYLPTMSEDFLPMARSALTAHDTRGKFYECPRGHPYFVSECGRPMQHYNCPLCGSPIGGINHQLASGNRIARITDNTETGYALGPPTQREAVPTSERNLHPPSCAIVRALMHSCLLWASCTNEHVIEGLLDLTKTQIRPAEMSYFFWQHLERDINLLSRATGKSKDEACLILHIILKNITTEQYKTQAGIETSALLQSRDARKQWEDSFNNTYILPVLNSLDTKLQQVIDLQMNDKREDHDRLFYIIHEKVSVPPKAILPHLWTYRSRITLEHLFQTLQTKKGTCPILHEFLQQEPLLRATKFIPGIVKLQQQMFELSHRKLDKSDVAQLTIGHYINEILQKRENRKNQFQENLKCVRSAWMLVKEKLKEHARVQIDPEFIRTITWDESTPLSYLIPTLTDHGTCTVALLDLLVGVHNDFVEKCRIQLKKKQKKEILWKEHKVPVSQIQHCHLLDYERQILSIVLSHCHYSLEHGKGQNVTYDLPALEKHIVDRFIHGKPLIQLEIPQVVYRKDVYTAQVFANIRKNVSPQIKLTGRQQNEIITELHSMQKLRECLDVVEIVIGFLSSGSTNSTTELHKYVKKVLKMEKKFKSKKAMEYCTLGHILSLWETISVQMAKILTIRKQEPFDSLGNEFLQKLDIDTHKELEIFLRKTDIPPLLSVLYEFIETYVRHCREPNEKDWTLVDTLSAHLDIYGLDNSLPPDFKDNFPPNITVGQTVATWKAIVIYQQKHEQETKT